MRQRPCANSITRATSDLADGTTFDLTAVAQTMST